MEREQMQCFPAGSESRLSADACPGPDGAEDTGVSETGLLRPTSDHTICVEVSGVRLGKLLPFTVPNPEAIWSSEYVKMPFSTSNWQTQSVPGQRCEGRVVHRWEVIKEALDRPDFKTAMDLVGAIRQYNPKYASVWTFMGLHHYLKQMHHSERQFLLERLLPRMAQLALRLPELCQLPIQLLRVGMKHAISMSQEQIACLLANAFFCTFPHRNSTRRRSEYSDLPSINFNRLFEITSQRTLEKLNTIFCYFRMVTENMPKGLVTFQRCGLDSPIEWKRSRCTVTQLHATSEGTIEDKGKGMLQVDFASAMVGGGVLGQGLLQEEVRFLINPELIVARLFTERLGASECLVITGAQRYSEYTGYSDSYRWARPHHDTTPRDSWLRRQTEIVAIDALHFSDPIDQYKPHCLKRELTKAYCGFSCRVIPDMQRKAVATGNWGCGAFKGDVKLKALIQTMAAAQAGRNMMYFTFGDVDSMTAIQKMHQFLQSRNVTVGRIYNLLEKYSQTAFTGSRPDLYDFIQSNVDCLRGRY
ncbi:poly(ADP-ribose) glycohydrolase-like [Hypanus sabinus]|uniref:poly(ADP-ribose) glycohydrolase-like n=1 Tax=Hypanus sabinus TaxID=79690 RepID=UPI0028C45DAE|nr:poly(ADP-ribose) glycohydrolase-like [Hypanus sabinus]XP_059819853.1 poly(ADP-ribose) glycohydrolase-like [Hypanus sabinus]XP_059819863.1 poly(ADP-ribose) glycohydrolase-like [Hypanus sabinus]